MRQRHLYTWAVISLGALSLSAASEPSETNLMSVARANLCVTEGAIEELPGEQLSVSVSKMRAYVNAFTPQLIEAQLYLPGPNRKRSTPRVRRTPPPIRPQAARPERLQPGLRDVAHRTRIGACGLGQEQPRPTD